MFQINNNGSGSSSHSVADINTSTTDDFVLEPDSEYEYEDLTTLPQGMIPSADLTISWPIHNLCNVSICIFFFNWMLKIA